MCGLRNNSRLKMTYLTSLSSEYNDQTNQEKLVKLWGNSLKSLTPKQRQLVVEILSNSSLTQVEA
jgi:hypothetical protein